MVVRHEPPVAISPILDGQVGRARVRDRSVLARNISGDRDGQSRLWQTPLNSRYKPGQSGNPSGRPKGAASFRSDFAAELGELVSEGGST